MKRLVAVLLATWLAMPGAAIAQVSQGAQQPAQTDQAQPPAESVDPTKLGVDLSRIRRELGEPDGEGSSDGPLRLRFSVQVIGVAPRINIMDGFPADGPVPYGPPTHQEFLSVVTPRQYSWQPDFLGLAVMAAQKLVQFSKKQRCEAEIAEYRQLVMQGVPIAAPRCTQ